MREDDARPPDRREDEPPLPAVLRRDERHQGGEGGDRPGPLAAQQFSPPKGEGRATGTRIGLYGFGVRSGLMFMATSKIALGFAVSLSGASVNDPDDLEYFDFQDDWFAGDLFLSAWF